MPLTAWLWGANIFVPKAMPSIIKRSRATIFAVLFIVAGVFLPRVSFAETLAGQLISTDSLSDSGYANNDLNTVSLSGATSATRFYFYWGSGSTNVDLWLLNASGANPVDSGLGYTYGGNTVVAQGCVASTTPQKCWVPIGSGALLGRTSLAIIMHNAGSNYSTRGRQIGSGTAGFWPYFALTDSSGDTGFSSSISPTNPTSQTYMSNPIPFTGTYNNVNTYNQIVYEINQTDLGVQLAGQVQNIPLVNGTGLTYSSSRNLPYQGNYTYRAKLYDTTTGSSTAWSSAISFAVGTTTIATSSRDTMAGAPQPLDCSALDIACHLKNAVVWLFYPTDDSTTQFSNLTLRNSFPFAYVYQVGDLRNELFNASSSSATTTVSVSIPSMSGSGTTTLTFLSASMINAVPYTSTIKTILGWLLWLMLIEYVYYRTIRVHDSNTPKT